MSIPKFNPYGFESFDLFLKRANQWELEQAQSKLHEVVDTYMTPYMWRRIYTEVELPNTFNKCNVHPINTKPALKGHIKVTFENGDTQFVPVRSNPHILSVEFIRNGEDNTPWDYEDPLN